MLRNIAYILAGLSALFLLMVLRPVPLLTEEDCEKTQGIIERIHEGPSMDIVIRLKSDDTFYYINRGLERA